MIEPRNRDKLAGFAFVFCFLLFGFTTFGAWNNLYLTGANNFGLPPFDLSVLTLMGICLLLTIRLLRIYISLISPSADNPNPNPSGSFFTGLTSEERTFREIMQVLTANTLFVPEEFKKQPSCLSFGITSIGHLELVKPIPALIDLTHLQVKRWSDGSASNSTTGFDFVGFLLRANQFNRSNYFTIEKYLRNNGNHDEADAIHRIMHNTAQALEKSWPKTLFNLLHSFIGYGTQLRRLVLLMLFWFAFSCTWFWQVFPDTFELSPSYSLQLANHQKETNTPKDAGSKIILNNTHKLEAITGLVLRYHLPILNIDLVPHIEPKTDWMKGYTLLVLLSHWMFWPVLLTSLVRSLIPTRD